MAVDTKAKRFSMLNFGDGTTITVVPDPDGTIAQGDRQHLLDGYAGILWTAAVVFDVPRTIVVPVRTLTSAVSARTLTSAVPSRGRVIVVPSDAP